MWFRHPPGAVTSLPSLEEGVVADGEEESGWILRDVSLTVEPGELVALVGPSGAGKTTTALLVPRIADVSEGSVLVDGHDVRDLTLDSLRDSVGFVMQDPHLFHDTISNNLRYARQDATDDEIVAACKAARINDLIVSLPEGYGTLVGERGYRMSGGEKQRLAIARMLLKDPAIVILDEATSHLDSESELAIQRALADALRGRTALVIAHRLSTIVNADRILVMDDGRIIEQGRHAELLRAARAVRRPVPHATGSGGRTGVGRRHRGGACRRYARSGFLDRNPLIHAARRRHHRDRVPPGAAGPPAAYLATEPHRGSRGRAARRRHRVRGDGSVAERRR